MCSNVLLPDPDAPTMAIDSPAVTVKLTSFNTSTGTLP